MKTDVGVEGVNFDVGDLVEVPQGRDPPAS